MASIAAREDAGGSDPRRLDLVVVGAGPAGFAATLAAKERGLRCETLEQDTLGGTVSKYPRGKIVMTAPVALPIVGLVQLRETTKEHLLAFWQDVEAKSCVAIRYEQRVVGIDRSDDGFVVRTENERFETRAVLLAIGRRGTPRQLDVPGEDANKVVYRLLDPEQYASRRVLVAGGGDSAIEAATEIAELGRATVTLVHRSGSFDRAKPKNRARLEEAERAGRLRVLVDSKPIRIEPDTVELMTPDGPERVANDDVIVCIGGILPTDFLRSIGIEIETRHGT